jgi:hypothetical protein
VVHFEELAQSCPGVAAAETIGAQCDVATREYIIPLLNEYRASWAIIRQWTGNDPAIIAREEHIQKLERLVWDAIYASRKRASTAKPRSFAAWSRDHERATLHLI